MKKIFLLLLPTVFLACQTHYEVKNYYEWCAHEVGQDLGHPSLATTYDYAGIRESFIQYYNDILAEEILVNHFWDSTINHMEEAQMLIEERHVGVRREGNALHFANEHMTPVQFREDAERFKNLLNYSSLSQNTQQLNEYQLCLYRSIDQLFHKVVLHNGQKEISIPLDFSFRERFLPEN